MCLLIDVAIIIMYSCFPQLFSVLYITPGKKMVFLLSIILSDDSEAQVVSIESTMTDFQIAVDYVFLFPNCIIHKFLHCDFIGSVYHVTL